MTLDQRLQKQLEIQAEYFRQACGIQRNPQAFTEVEEQGKDILALVILAARLSVRKDFSLADQLRHINDLNALLLETALPLWLDQQ